MEKMTEDEIVNDFIDASLCGDIDTLQSLWTRFPEYHSVLTEQVEIMDAAAEWGSLSTLQWLHDLNFKCSTDAMNLAAENNHFSVVVWLHNNRSEGCTSDALLYSAQKGHVKMTEWLLENRHECNSQQVVQKAALNALRKGVMEVIHVFIPYV